MATHTIGDTSSPLNGLTTRLVAASKGSVGVYAMDQGSFVASTSGYQVSTIRTIIKRDENDRMGRNTVASTPAVVESNPCARSAIGIELAIHLQFRLVIEVDFLRSVLPTRGSFDRSWEDGLWQLCTPTTEGA